MSCEGYYVTSVKRIITIRLETSQIFEEDGEDDVSESLGANRNHDQVQVHALEDHHDQVGDFDGMPIYDVYDDELSTTLVYDFCGEPCYKSDVMSKVGTSPQRKFLSPNDTHEINGNMTRKTLLDRPIFTSDMENYYVPVTNLKDEPIYDVSDDEVFIDSHYCRDPLFNDEDEVQGFNNGGDFHVVVDDGSICVRKEHINFGLGEQDCHQQFHRKPPYRNRHKGHTYPDLVTTHKGLTNGCENPKLLDKTRRILKLEYDQDDCLSELSPFQKHALENKITYLQKTLALEKEKSRNLEQELNETLKRIRMLNKGSATLDKILSMGRTAKSTMGLGYQGDSSTSQIVFVRENEYSQQENSDILRKKIVGMSSE
ncbi:hypothetical protein F2Q69_00019736 [Brassica cretica]|uniref:Uncharacterized protein n=1 Tax=Brassica cretica TaxID=69181 RepID=A0A8S9QGG6_BRACR|nr:hypothetical protein F2Q69_00019736 [Brassica cretica]